MNSFSEDLKFKYTWRKYQEKFLSNVNDYLTDNHLHIVAPPGSGKTVLGLEIMLRINKPTLIVAPTLAIRNQWIQRFCDLFLNTDSVPEWISTDIRNPNFVTVTTYQGIHVACNNLKENDVDIENINGSHSSTDISSILKKFKKQKIGTFILDEAHHLKNAWWKSLMDLKKDINPTIVALTATPPFDVSGSEWQKYVQLNGPVDVEISVPELMIEGDLCPHQDLVYFTLPTQKEQEEIEHYHIQACKFFDEIKNDDEILKAIQNNSVYQNPQLHLEWIYENISSYTSGLVYLNFREKEIQNIHFEIIGDEQKFIPEFDFFWLEELLDFYLFVDDIDFKKNEEHQLSLENRLKRNGFLENKMVSFFNNKNLSQIFNSSIGKLQGIKDIVDFEYSVLRDDLKMVILTDYIKKEYVSNTNENNFELDKIGVIPIFEKLRRENSQSKRIGILTGSVVIMPKSAREIFDKFCTEKRISNVSTSPLSYDHEYFLVNLVEQMRHDIVHIVTEIFELGEIQILIGTKSLLGEGWDAPKMNTLVLASFVSSFVLSNQMRGRVIRTQKDNSQKTGNIWHLVCFDEKSENGGRDFEILKRRFKTFVGISNENEPVIENNFERLNIKSIESNNDILSINQKTLKFAGNRKDLSKRWKMALGKGNILIEEIRIPIEEMKEIKGIKKTYLKKMIGNFSGIVVFSIIMFWWDFLIMMFRTSKVVTSIMSFSGFAFLFGAVGFLVYGGKFYRASIQYAKYKDITKHIELIGNVVLKSLINERIIQTPVEDLKISSDDNYEYSTCYLEGGNNYEKSQFIQTLQELISPVDNPKYLLKQQSSFFFIRKAVYYPLPEVFGKNKKGAESFRNVWSEMIEKSNLIFTRTVEGRKILLKLRFQALMKRNVRIEHLHKWTR